MSASYARRIAGAACALFLVITAAACGSDDAPSGPSANFDVVGAWDWRVTNATGQNANGQKATCTVTDVTLIFTRSNGVLSGKRFSSGGGNLVCAFDGKPASPANFTTDAPIQSLVLNGTGIKFEFGNLTGGPWEMAGSITGNNSMGGNAKLRIATSAGVFTLTGPWTATRK